MSASRAAIARNRDVWVLGAVMFIATALTLPGFANPTWHAGPWVVDNVLHYLRDTALNSKFVAYPMLQANLLAATVVAFCALQVASGAWTWPELYANLIDWRVFMPVANGLSLVVGLAAIVATYWLGRSVADRTVGLLAATLLALTPTFNDYCHEAVPDATMTTLAALAWVFLANAADNPSRRNYLLAGLFTGLATAAKYNAGMLGVLGVGVHLWHRLRPGERSPQARWSYLLQALLLGVAAFSVTSFQVLLEPHKFLHSVLVYERDYKLLAYSGAVDPASFIPWLSHLGVCLRSEHGIALLFGVGLIGCIFRRTPARLLMVVGVLLALAYIGRWRMVHMRFYLFLYPALAVMAADAVVVGLRHLRTHRPIFARAAAVAVAGLVLWTVVVYGRDSLSLLLPDTRELSRAWIEANIPPGAVIAGPTSPEGYPALLPMERVEDYLSRGEIPTQHRETVSRILKGKPVYRLLPLRQTLPEPVFPESWPGPAIARLKRSEYARREASRTLSLDHVREQGAQYIVTSSTVYDMYLEHQSADELPRYDPRTAAFPEFRRFYIILERVARGETERGIRLLNSFEPRGGQRIGPTIRVYRLAPGSR
ncbi:MAG: glycosyltransferase family 39 protein [Armatimonadetes bacterium]|nr:glycosyltransferase family 39 protein [Armatimonadota bacterium]